MREDVHDRADPPAPETFGRQVRQQFDAVQQFELYQP